jgi:hypothetical protein
VAAEALNFRGTEKAIFCGLRPDVREIRLMRQLILILALLTAACERTLADLPSSPDVDTLGALLDAAALPHSELIVFDDEAALLERHDGRGVVVRDGKVEHLTLWSAGLLDLEPFLRLTSLRSLDLFGNRLRLGPVLDPLVSLERLSLSANGIQAAAPLGRLPALRELRLDYNRLNAVAGLGLDQLPALELLSLEGNALVSCDGLQALPTLRELFIGLNQLPRLDCVAGAGRLALLKAFDNRLETLAPLGGLAALVEVDADNNQLGTLAGLERLPKLQRVAIRDNPPLDTNDERVQAVLKALGKRKVFVRHDLPMPTRKLPPDGYGL